MALLTGTQQLVSYCSFSGIVVFGGPKLLFFFLIRFSTEHVLCEVGLYLHVQPPAWRTKVSLIVWVITLTCPAC